MKTEQRTCTTCRKRKPVSAFANNAPACRVCNATRHAAYRTHESVAHQRLTRAFEDMHVAERVNATRAQKG